MLRSNIFLPSFLERSNRSVCNLFIYFFFFPVFFIFFLSQPLFFVFHWFRFLLIKSSILYVLIHPFFLLPFHSVLFLSIFVRNLSPCREQISEMDLKILKVASQLIFKVALSSLIAPLIVGLYEYLWFILHSKYGGKGVKFHLFLARNVSKPIILNNQTLDGRLNRVLTHDLFNYLVTFLFPCFFLLMYLRPRSIILSFLLLLPGLLAYTIQLVGYGFLGCGLCSSFSVLADFILLYLVMKFLVCPKKSLLPQEIFKITVVTLIGTMYTVFKIPKNTDGMRLINTCLLLPFLKEVGIFFISNSVYYLTLDRSVAKNPDRKIPVILVLCYNICITILFRLEVASFDSAILSYVSFTFQNLIEVISRRQMQTKDAFLSKTVIKKVFDRRSTIFRGNSESVAPNINENESQTKSFEETNSEIIIEKREYFTQLIISLMMGEYAGMFISSLFLYIYSDMKLFASFQAYFNGVPTLFDIITMLIFQVFLEFITDIYCVYYEMKSDGRNFIKAWENQPLRYFVWFCASSLFASFLAFSVGANNNAESLSYCYGRDLCYCVDHGLLKGGVREEFCYLIYENGTPDSRYIGT